jgi:pimeloyl-ACP methyl ester carboxylesterase
MWTKGGSMPFVERPGATIWYEDRGPADGVPVLLIHGGLFDPMTGERFWITPGVVDDLVAAGFRCIVPDRRYCGGRTRADFTGYAFSDDANDTIAILDAIGARSCHVVAGSNGCSVALSLAGLHAGRIGRVQSLTLCWPPIRNDAALRAAFQRSASMVRAVGVEGYLETLRRDGVPHPTEDRPGWPFGVGLTRDERASASFRAHDAETAARRIEVTAHLTLIGWILRGIDETDVDPIARKEMIAVVPPEPEDAFHDYAAAELLVRMIPGARLLAGAPITPSPHFAACRRRFSETLVSVMRDA